MSEKDREVTKKNVVENPPPDEAALSWLWLESLKSLKGPVGFLAAILTVSVIYLEFLDSRVKQMVQDPDFVARVAQHARPAIVFDAEGRLLANAGAYRYLGGVPEVQLGIKDETVNVDSPLTFTRIIVRPKVALPNAPTVEALDSGEVSVKASQIAGTAWEIRVDQRERLITTEVQPTNLAPYRYRLEIISPFDEP